MTVINTNVKALTSQASLSNVEKLTATTMERLSTGLRINSAKDDAAGLAITNRMTSQIRGYAVAIRNSNDGISMAQTAEGAMGQVTSMLQRMRELSVQSSNGSLNTSDRKSIQQEVDQLKQEIDNIATKTNHNNIKLLDGSAGKITLQTGVNAGDTMKISFNSVATKDIGLGSRASLSAVGTNFATTATPVSLADGDLLVNGVSVGASLATDDKLSYKGNEASAIAKAAAINRVADQSGVHATVGQTTVNGSVMTADISSGTLTINGVDTATVYTSKDAELSRAAVVTAINNISEQTGVKAINTHDDSKGVVLVAADGRNVSLAMGGSLNTDTSGLAAADKTYTGTYELNTLDGSSITVSSNVSGKLSNSGLEYGTYAADTAQSVTLARTATTTTAAPGELKGNTLVINNIGIDAANANDDNASADASAIETSSKSASAIAIAAAINKKTDLTGVTATAEPNIINGTSFTADSVGSFKINGVDVPVDGGGFNSRDDVIKAVNQVQGQTGVMAEANGDGIRLVAQDGRNVTVDTSAADPSAIGLGGSVIGTDPITFYSKVKLSSDKAFTVDSGSEGNDTNLAALGFRKGTFGGADNGLKVKDIDVTTQQGATDAIKAIDAAITSVSADEARAGAFQNRLDAVVSNLTESNQNMSASRSRILDTDYATETSNLAKSQIISQAATAMLAQANQSAQSVLSLLK